MKMTKICPCCGHTHKLNYFKANLRKPRKCSRCGYKEVNKGGWAALTMAMLLIAVIVVESDYPLALVIAVLAIVPMNKGRLWDIHGHGTIAVERVAWREVHGEELSKADGKAV